MEDWLSEKIGSLALSATAEVDNLVKSMKQEGVRDIVSMGVGEPCFDTPDNIKKAAYEALKAGKTKYEPTAGNYELREAICEKFKQENNIHVDVSDVIATPGGKFGIFLAFQAVLSEKDRVMILDPAWVSYEPAARIASAGVVRVPTSEVERFQPDVEAIERAMDKSVKIIVINSPNNPTGAVYDASIIRSIVKLASDNDVLVLSDETYEYLIYEGTHYSPGSEFDNVITVNSFSKSHAMTGWRLGYLTAPQDILEGMIKVYQHSASCATSLAQYGGIEALKSEESREARGRMLQGYEERRALMLSLIRQSAFFDCSVEPSGTFYCFPSYNFKQDSVEFAKKLLEEVHVATVPGGAFGEAGEGHLRLSYATEPRLIEEGFERMEDYLGSNKHVPS